MSEGSLGWGLGSALNRRDIAKTLIITTFLTKQTKQND